MEYAILVANLGPSDVRGVTVVDLFPAELTDVSWSCSAVAGAGCNPTGSGDIDQQVDLPPGEPAPLPESEQRVVPQSIREDPVTGSLNASVAQWMLASKRVTAPYVASQGTCLERSGRIEISQDRDGAVWVGGCTRTLIEGDVVDQDLAVKSIQIPFSSGSPAANR